MPSPSNSIPSNPWLHFNMERIQLRAEVTDRSKIILWKSRKETLAASFSQSRLLPGGKENWRFPPIINGVRSCWCFVTIIHCSFCKWWWYILCVSYVCFYLPIEIWPPLSQNLCLFSKNSAQIISCLFWQVRYFAIVSPQRVLWLSPPLPSFEVPNFSAVASALCNTCQLYFFLHIIT